MAAVCVVCSTYKKWLLLFRCLEA